MKKEVQVCSGGGGGVCVYCMCMCMCVFFSKIYPQESLQLKESLYKLRETANVELAPGLMLVYELISQSCGDS